MKCPECVKAGEKSTVTEGCGSTTLMYCAPWYDEDGRYHHHDYNTTTTPFRCSRGHEWAERSRGMCPTCGPEDKWVAR